MKKINITSGWYFLAGDKFGWSKDFPVEGVGLKMEYLTKNKKLKITVNDIEYSLESAKALDFIDQYKSSYMQKATELGVITKGILERLTPLPPQMEEIEVNGERIARVIC